jgi:hypothetical protein
MPTTPQETEPADVSTLETEVVYVQAKPRKLRLHMLDYNDDLRCQWWGPPGPQWKGEGYYTSTVSHAINKDGETITVPVGSHFIVELEEAKEIDGVPVGDYARMTCLDPRDSDKMLSFGHWYGVQEDQSPNFNKIENDMMVLAIAATGLAL